MKPAIFIDRDGVLNDMVFDDNHGLLDSPRRIEQVRAKKGAAEFLRKANEAGIPVIVITNQPGIAKATMTQDDLDAVNGELARQLAEGGGRWDDLYFSPYHPNPGPDGVPAFTGKTDCRKPGPGMLLSAAEKHDIDLSRSWMIGDGIVDVQAGNRSGCRTILLTTVKISHIEQFIDMQDGMPDAVVKNLAEAWTVISESAAS